MMTINLPLTEEKIKELRAGDIVLLSGTVYGARDMAHQRLVSAINNNKELPIDLRGSTIFYVGPAPTPPGRNSGSLGPTTSIRMDNLTEPLLKKGVKATIGKGARTKKFRKLLEKYKAVYLVAIGGIAAYLSTKVKEIKKIAYSDLEAEAIYRIELDKFPLFVAYDIYGGDIFEHARLKE